MDLSASTTELIASVSNIPADMALIVALAMVGAYDGFQAAGTRVATLALALIMAVQLYTFIPHTALLGTLGISAATFGGLVIAALVVGLYFALRRFTDAYGYGASGILSALLAGIGLVAIVVSMWLSTPALMSLWSFGPEVQRMFAEGYRLYLIVGGIAALALARG